MRRASILAALANAILLLVAVGGIAWEAIQRLGHPGPVAGNVVMAVAGLGVVINGSGAFRPGNVPFGGNKQSGIGRESIVDTVHEMTAEKTIVINNAL